MCSVVQYVLVVYDTEGQAQEIFAKVSFIFVTFVTALQL